MRWLDGITDAMYVSLSKLREIVKHREAWRAAVHEATTTEWLNNNIKCIKINITTNVGDQKFSVSKILNNNTEDKIGDRFEMLRGDIYYF